MIRVKYKGQVPVQLKDGRVLGFGDEFEVEEHESERSDLEVVTNASIKEAGLHRTGQADNQRNSSSAE